MAVHGGLTTISRSTTHCPTRVGSVELDIPFMVVADFMARTWQLVGGCRFYLNGEGGWNLLLCKKTQLHGVIDSSLELNDVISFHHLIQLTATLDR